MAGGELEPKARVPREDWAVDLVPELGAREGTRGRSRARRAAWIEDRSSILVTFGARQRPSTRPQAGQVIRRPTSKVAPSAQAPRRHRDTAAPAPLRSKLLARASPLQIKVREVAGVQALAGPASSAGSPPARAAAPAAAAAALRAAQLALPAGFQPLANSFQQETPAGCQLAPCLAPISSGSPLTLAACAPCTCSQTPATMGSQSQSPSRQLTVVQRTCCYAKDLYHVSCPRGCKLPAAPACAVPIRPPRSSSPARPSCQVADCSPACQLASSLLSCPSPWSPPGASPAPPTSHQGSLARLTCTARSLPSLPCRTRLACCSQSPSWSPWAAPSSRWEAWQP